MAARGDPPYPEALAIIRAGKDQLAQRPEADMAEFQPCSIDRQRERKYLLWRQIEAANRQAIREGRKAYDRSQSTVSQNPHD